MALQVMPPDGQKQAPEALRIGIVLDSYIVSAWKASVVEDLWGAAFVKLAAVALVSDEKAPRRPNWGTWLFDKYATWDANRLPQEENDPLRDVNLSDRLAGFSGILATAHLGVEDLATYQLDVLIWLASGNPDLALRSVARYGVWLYRARQPDHFWEIYEANPVTRSALEVLHENLEAPLVAYEGYSATEQGWSWRQNRKVPCSRASTFAVRCLQRLYNSGFDGLRSLKLDNGTPSVSPVEEVPTNLQVASFLIRNAARTISRRILYAEKESYWFVACRTDQTQFVSNSEELDLQGFKRIPAPAEHFYADPFVIEWKGRNYLFVEDYLFKDRRGCISVMEIGSRGEIGEADRVLDLPYHLSYPFVFEHEGDLFMIPETLGARRIELYRATEGPTKWEFVKALRENVQAVDTTLWVEGETFFFFTNIMQRGATVNDELYLFSSDRLLGDWKPHPANPIVTDVRRSRGAGKLFRRNGKLIRPAQDCSVRYGYACQFNEVEVLSPTKYREKPSFRIEPDWAPGLIGTHTINSNAAIEVIDGQIYGKRYRGTDTDRIIPAST